MKKNFITLTKVALVLVYLVIVAGALVRMTGSGMGCPDWPKCFGYYIPPTDIHELQWAPNREFKHGQVIIKDEKLWVAQQDFTSGSEYNTGNWEPYTKHDYAEFNPMHTWVEYINRLVGALAGIAVFAMAAASVAAFGRTKTSVILLSWLAVFFMGFQAWLGATVVYSVLNPVKITLHMVMALVIVLVLLNILNKAKGIQHTEKIYKYDPFFNKLLWTALVFTLIQIILGTQVRQFVDDQVKLLGYENMGLVMQDPSVAFYIHRSFSILVLGLNIWIFNMNKQKSLGFAKPSWVLVLLLLEIASGIAMYYLEFPFASQAIHMVIAAVLFGIQYYMILESRRGRIALEEARQ